MGKYENLENIDNLTKDALLAEQAGMTYGKWKALHPYTKPDPNRHGPRFLVCRCKICGKIFETTGRRKAACSDACYGELHRRNNRESHERRKALRALAGEDEK